MRADEVLHRPRDRSLVFSQEKGGFVDVRNPDGPVQPVVELGRNACVRRSVVDDIQEKRNSRKISALHMLVSQQASQARPDGHRPATSPGLPQSGYVRNPTDFAVLSDCSHASRRDMRSKSLLL